MSFYEISAESQGYFYFNKVTKSQETPPHFHGAIELLFCVDGEQELYVGGETCILQKGDACFIDGYVVHSLPPSGAELYVVLGDRLFFEPFFKALGDKTLPALFRFDNYGFLSTLYSLHKKVESPYTCWVERCKGLVQILLCEIAETAVFERRKENKQNDLVANILKYAAERFTQDLSLWEISRRFGYSHDYLSRVLHRYLGVHWNVYVGNLRARKAHGLLQTEKGVPVLDIALRCGFESLNTFYRAYRRVFGTPPLKKDNF